mgnify:CR=1 FL=1
MTDKIQKILDKINKPKKEEGDIAPTLMRASDVSNKFKLLKTPWATINKLIGGFPLGRFTTIAGPSQTGKTALILQTIAHNQKIDPNFITLWTDFENQFDNSWAERLGVDLDRIILQNYTDDANYMEKLLDKALALIDTKTISAWVIDSIGAMMPKADVQDKHGERSLEENNMLRLQIKLGEFYRKCNPKISPVLPRKDKEDNIIPGYDGCAVILLGHVYTVPTTSGAKLEEVKGGNAVKHWAHVRLLTKRGPKKEWPAEIATMGIDGTPIKIHPGWSGRIKLDKTRQNANEGQEVLLNFFHGRGFDWKDSTISAALGLGIIERAGPSYVCDIIPEGKIKGKDALFELFGTNEELYKKLADRVDSFVVTNNLIDIESIKNSEEEVIEDEDN